MVRVSTRPGSLQGQGQGQGYREGLVRVWVIVTVLWFDLKCMLRLFCVCIQLCWKRSSQISRLRTGNGEHRKGEGELARWPLREERVLSGHLANSNYHKVVFAQNS